MKNSKFNTTFDKGVIIPGLILNIGSCLVTLTLPESSKRVLNALKNFIFVNLNWVYCDPAHFQRFVVPGLSVFKRMDTYTKGSCVRAGRGHSLQLFFNDLSCDLFAVCSDYFQQINAIVQMRNINLRHCRVCHLSA